MRYDLQSAYQQQADNHLENLVHSIKLKLPYPLTKGWNRLEQLLSFHILLIRQLIENKFYSFPSLLNTALV